MPQGRLGRSTPEWPSLTRPPGQPGPDGLTATMYLRSRLTRSGWIGSIRPLPQPEDPERGVVAHAAPQGLGADAGDAADFAAQMGLVGVARCQRQFGPVWARGPFCRAGLQQQAEAALGAGDAPQAAGALAGPGAQSAFALA